MMNDEPTICDRCTAEMVIDVFSTAELYAFPTQNTDPDEYVIEERLLCSGCQRDVLAFIDGDYTRDEDALDRGDRVQSAASLRNAATELTELADRLATDLDPDADFEPPTEESTDE